MFGQTHIKEPVGKIDLSKHELITMKEVEEKLHINAWGVFQIKNRVELRTFTIGSRRLTSSLDLDDYIQHHREESN